jgi:hypothetical protein
LLFHVPCRLDVISDRYSLHGPLARIVLFGRPVFSQGSVQNGQNISGIFARMLPPHLFVRPLSGPFGQSRRTHFQGEFHSLHIFILLKFLFAQFLWMPCSRSREVKDEPISSILCKSSPNPVCKFTSPSLDYTRTNVCTKSFSFLYIG